MKQKKSAAALGLLFLFSACYFDNKEELYQNLSQPCDLSNVSFQNDIKPIMTANCSFSGCHDSNTSAGGLDLSVFSGVSSSGKSGVLLNRLKGIGGSQMPQSAGPLSNCQIQVIQEWVSAGALEN